MFLDLSALDSIPFVNLVSPPLFLQVQRPQKGFELEGGRPVKRWGRRLGPDGSGGGQDRLG